MTAGNPTRTRQVALFEGLDEFGRLLDEGWRLKQEVASKISNDKIDELYERARSAGALGGKLPTLEESQKSIDESVGRLIGTAG